VAGGGQFSIAHHSHPAQLDLAGDFDLCSTPHLTAALSDAADGTGVLHVDLSGVQFCDITALQAIIRVTRAKHHARRPGRSLVLHHVPGQVAEILRITGWDALPGLIVDSADPETLETL